VTALDELGVVLERSTLLKGAPILVVEDDLVQALDLAESLREAGACVLGPVSDLNEAVRLARAGNCRGAILDFQLGSSNAVQIAHELESLETPFVVYTGYHCADQMPSHWWGCRLVSKPANMARLVRTLAALMRCKRLFARKTRPGIHPMASPLEGRAGNAIAKTALRN
jgi:DNA-binding response OmpR family regulator